MKSILRLFTIFVFLHLFLFSFSQDLTQKINQYRKNNENKIIDEYISLVSIPNVSRDTANILRTAAFIKTMMEQRGIKTEFLDAISPKFNPVVFGEVKVPGAKYTLSFYAHYDGQPVNPAKWTGGLKPFEPVFIDKPIEQGGKIMSKTNKILPEWRLTGRAVLKQFSRTVFLPYFQSISEKSVLMLTLPRN